jgi:hypothetical protein
VVTRSIGVRATISSIRRHRTVDVITDITIASPIQDMLLLRERRDYLGVY